ncbi:MAG TPA: hypothetical protein VIR65_05090 [Rhizorhapis sp.]
MKIPLSLLAILALGACQSAPGSRTADDVPSTQTPGPGGSGQTYKALGTEPFWALQIENGKMTFQTPHGPTVIATAIQAGPSFNGWRYTSEPLSVDITFAVCSDGMSDRRYHDTVMVLVGEQEYRGCGGDFLPSSNATEDSANP